MNRDIENYVGWKMLKMMYLKIIERTFPPLNFWWVRTQKFSTKLQTKCNFTHPTNLFSYFK